jgi:uncharacterized repeat protein (TIGR03803 family)
VILLAVQWSFGQNTELRLKSFGFVNESGSQPAGLLAGADGALYGTTTSGGTNYAGTVFRVNPDGSGYAVLHTFATNGVDGQSPAAGVVQGRDGFLYGTTPVGGSNQVGTVFRLDVSGSSYTLLHHFGTDLTDGSRPAGTLVQGKDGALYGATSFGGTNFLGTVFRLGTDGAFTTLYHFGNFNEDGSSPVTLLQGADGALYGSTSDGGTNGSGAIFVLSTNGSGYRLLYSFGTVSNDGSLPAALVQGTNGNLYGTTSAGGSASKGTLFSIKTNGTGYVLLHHFTGTLGDGGTPEMGLLQGANGWLYGTTRNGGSMQDDGTVYKLRGDGSGYQVIRRFTVITSLFYDTFSTDGQQPGPLAQGANGMLYGATFYGGTSGGGAYQSEGAGTLFTLATDTTGYAVIYDFSVSGGDGATPMSGLLSGQDGAFYGTTDSGGPGGQGTVFRINADGRGYEVLYGFGLSPIDGLNPQGGLSQGSDGTLYGTTTQGGYQGGSGSGGVFKINPDGTGYALLHSFGVFGIDGAGALSPPLLAQDGNLYGTTADGGYESPWGGFGTIYKVNTSGTVYSVLHLFNTNSLEGRSPQGGLIQARDGALYGTAYGGTKVGGFGQSYGTLFKILTNGSFQLLHTFTNNNTDGTYPAAALLQASDGALYGTTVSGGTNNAGTVFKINPDTTGYQVLYNFGASSSDGKNPQAALVQGPDGFLYGTTSAGGLKSFSPFGGGAVFKLSTNGTGYTVLYNFGANRGDGRTPAGGVAFGPDAGLYGTTQAGGDMNLGTLFRFGPPLFEITAFSRLPMEPILSPSRVYPIPPAALMFQPICSTG